MKRETAEQKAKRLKADLLAWRSYVDMQPLINPRALNALLRAEREAAAERFDAEVNYQAELHHGVYWFDRMRAAILGKRRKA